MKVNIYLSVAGQEAVAKGDTPQYWDLCVRYCDITGYNGVPPEGGQLLAAEVPLAEPDHKLCVQHAIEHLRKEQQRVYAEAAKEAQALKQREESLLALAYTPADKVSW